MATAIDLMGAQVVGIVDSVSPREIVVRLDLESPQATALNAGHVQRFPQINGWVLIPSEVGYLVGTVAWIGTERAKAVDARRGGGEMVDLPSPVRRMTVVPLGTLSGPKSGAAGASELVRGVVSYPSVGEAVLVPSPAQAAAIGQGDTEARVSIGTSPLGGDVEVRADPDKLFGRHLAVLGNTGSGKSCTVAGLIRWSLEAARSDADGDAGRRAPNARFLILDPNGEYSKCFADIEGVRILSLTAEQDVGSDDVPLQVPAWLWNSDEWSAVLSAKPGIQRPVLHQALRDLRGGSRQAPSGESVRDRTIRGYFFRLREMAGAGLAGFQGWPGSKNFGSALENCLMDLTAHDLEDLGESAETLIEALRSAVVSQKWEGKASSGFNDFPEVTVRSVLSAFDGVVEIVGLQQRQQSGVNIDAPHEFDPASVPEHLEFLSGDPSFASSAQHVAPMVVRVRSVLADERINALMSKGRVTVEDWLATMLGPGSEDDAGTVTVINLSLVPSDVLHTCVSVIARVVFEALQRYRKVNRVELPTVLVLEEAHTFVSNHPVDLDSPTARYMCRTVFERIAREGRKFGLGLVLSSQRPSELSPTVLAQCNSFILHRLVNDADQSLVRRLVPDSLGELLLELPSLPSRHAVLLGWASILPTLVQVRELPEEHRPASRDPHFWDVWRGAEDRPENWAEVVSDWLR